MAEVLNSTLQQNLITLLAYSDEHGKVVANTLDPALFEGDYRLIAERTIDFWHKHKEAPKAHTADLLADILDDPHNRRGNTFRRILSSMVQLADSVNTGYVLDQLQTFTRMQRLKNAILESAEQLNSQQELAIESVEDIWNKLLRVKDTNFQPGLTLASIDHLLEYLQRQQTEFLTGIKELDSRYIVPARGEAMLLIGATGRGKTWWLINLGKQALLQRKKVLHLSLEMGEEQVAQRYYQSLFSISKRDKDVEITTLDLDKLDRVTGFGKEIVHPEFTFASPHVRDELSTRAEWMGKRIENLVIKRFPSLTIAGLRAYLDNLEIVEGFIPDLMLLDYIGLMKGTNRDFRLGLGEVFKDWRSILIERHMAGATAQQSSKEGANSMTVKMGNVAEDWSLTNTADKVLTYSSTDAEAQYGLARMYVSKARDEEDKFGVLLTQNYKMGQFVLASTYLDQKYFELMGDLEDADEDEDDDD